MLFYFPGLSAETIKTEQEILAVVLPENFDINAGTVSRHDCLASIMRSIGVDRCSEICYATIVDYYKPVFDDISGWKKDDGYIMIAGLKEFAKGVGNNDFAPERPVTVQECLAFMLRCIWGEDTVVFETVMSDAAKAGLISGNEQFLKNGKDSFLSANTFHLLLTRMVQHKRGWYWALEPSEPTFEKMQRDANGDQNYREYISEVLNKHTCLYCESGKLLRDPRKPFNFGDVPVFAHNS